MQDLRDEKVRKRLQAIWTDPHVARSGAEPREGDARDRRTARRRVEGAGEAKQVQARGRGDVPDALPVHDVRRGRGAAAEEVSFEQLLGRCTRDPSKFEPMVEQLWDAMDTGAFAAAIERKVMRFNGEFFKSHRALALGSEEIGELLRGGETRLARGRSLDLRHAARTGARSRGAAQLGAHYTPRAYVERLVVATIIEPLRDEWKQVLSTAERQKSEKRARTTPSRAVHAFHEKLCATRVLDPACGTGNFLYVSLELMKRLEGEVLDALADLGGQEALRGLEGQTVDPHQFLGPGDQSARRSDRGTGAVDRLSAMALPHKGGLPTEPILKAFQNIKVRMPC